MDTFISRYQTLIMNFELEKAISILERTPIILYQYLNGLPLEWTNENEGPDTWSPYDIIGHLIHGEKTDWLVRTKIILSQIPDQSFEPFDRFAQFEKSKGKTLNQLIEEFIDLRSNNLQALKAMNITDDQLSLKGKHPELGTVTLSQTLAAWVVHDLGHISQISRVMAKQYKSEVGPWTEYLTIVHN